jgi:Flp pilus assembly protein TadG
VRPLAGSWAAARRTRDDGAALAEFAIICPVLVMLIFSMITAGIAYNRNLSISYSAQQSARYAATLPLDNYSTIDLWLDAVHARVTTSSDGELEQGAEDRSICVAYVNPTDATTRSRTVTDNDATVTYANTGCFTDGLPATEERVHVVLSRADQIDMVVFGSAHLTLSKQVAAHYEVTG